MRYVVKRDYESHVGTYKAGDVLDVDAETGAWLERDSMGGIIPETMPETPPTIDSAENRAPEAPENDRMMRKSSKRQAR